MTPSDIYTELIQLVGNPSSTLYSQARAYMHMAFAEQELAYAVRFPEAQAKGNILMVLAQQEYPILTSLTDFFAIYGVSYPTLGTKLKRRSPDWFDMQQTFSTGPPMAYMRYGGSLWIDTLPTASEAGTNLLVRYMMLIPIIAVGSTVFTLPSPYHEMILYGALYRAQWALREYQQAMLSKQNYLSLVRSRFYAIEEEDFQDQGVPSGQDSSSYDEGIMILPEV